MRAEEAAKLAAEYNAGEPERRKLLAEQQLREVLADIEKEAGSGSMYTLFNRNWLMHEVCQQLIELGYTVDRMYSTHSCQVKWGTK